jgi:hypothetical protein
VKALFDEIKNFIPSERFEKSDIYFYGMGEHFLNFYHRCRLIGCELDGCEKISFVDSDRKKIGTNVGKKQIIPREQIKREKAIIFVSVTFKNFVSIAKLLTDLGFVVGKNIFHIQILDVFVTERLFARTFSLRNSQNGKSCFILGTGPSLRIDDLETLHRNGAITFSMNGIVKSFGETRWRPDYMVFNDVIASKNFAELWRKDIFYFYRFENGLEMVPAANNICFFAKKNVDAAVYLSRFRAASADEFSDDIFALQAGATTTFVSLQIANFMGFKNIYLLGVDHSWKREFDVNHHIVENDIDRNHFVDDYNEHSNWLSEHPNLSYPLDYSYECARKYADSHEVNIFNATRGGKLEVFQRVDFDSLF